MTYGTLFAIIILAGIIASAFINLESSKSANAYSGLSKALRVISVIVGAGVAAYWVGGIFDGQYKTVDANGIIRVVLLAIGVLAIGNLIYFATSKYGSEKRRAEVAEFKLHLVEKGLTLEQIDKQYYYIMDLHDGRKNIELEARNWFENHN